MSYRPKRTKKDKNHLDIVKMCREEGMIVWDLADLGGEILDIIVFWKGKILVVEIKDVGKEKNLTESEKQSIASLRKVGIEALVASNTQQIINAFEEKE